MMRGRGRFLDSLIDIRRIVYFLTLIVNLVDSEVCSRPIQATHLSLI